MSVTLQIESSQPAKRFRFSLRTLFWWQVVLIPAFLSPLYSELRSKQHPYVDLFAVIIAPVCYSALFVLWSSTATIRQRSPILAAVRRGSVFGALFGLLVWMVLWLPPFVEPIVRLGEGLTYAAVRASPWYLVRWTLSDLGEWVQIVGYLMLVYGVLGAATGGVIGLARDMITRNRVPAQSA